MRNLSAKLLYFLIDNRQRQKIKIQLFYWTLWVLIYVTISCWRDAAVYTVEGLAFIVSCGTVYYINMTEVAEQLSNVTMEVFALCPHVISTLFCYGKNSMLSEILLFGEK